ncbi:MAG: glycosyltransferase family A protein [Elusimicrobiota bacterium]
MSSQAPYFTVILPTRDRSAMLRSALKSLLWQTEGDFEAVVIDDGSTDDTSLVMNEFSGDKRLSFLRFKPQGLPRCRNAALRLARGRFVTFLDDDDMWLPERLREFRRAADTRPGVGFWFSNSYTWRFGRIIGCHFDPKRDIPEGRVPGWYAIGESRLPYVSTNMSISRQALAAAGFLREDIHTLADTELVVRVLAAGHEVGVLRDPLAVRRVHDGQITRDHVKAYEETSVVLKSAQLTDEEALQLRRGYARDTALYLIKGLETRKAREFMRDCGLPRDAAYWRLYAAALVPSCILSALRRMRALCVRRSAGGTVRDAHSLEAENSVRSIIS